MFQEGAQGDEPQNPTMDASSFFALWKIVKKTMNGRAHVPAFRTTDGMAILLDTDDVLMELIALFLDPTNGLSDKLAHHGFFKTVAVRMIMTEERRACRKRTPKQVELPPDRAVMPVDSLEFAEFIDRVELLLNDSEQEILRFMLTDGRAMTRRAIAEHFGFDLNTLRHVRASIVAKCRFLLEEFGYRI